MKPRDTDNPWDSLEAVTLRGAIVHLVPMQTDHIDVLFAAGKYDELWTHVSNPMKSRDDMAAYVNQAMIERAEGVACPFVITHVNGDVIGSTRFGGIDRHHRRLEIGWTWITPDWQRTAVNTEMKRMLLGFAFDDLRCERVQLKTDQLNTRSQRAIERLGAVREGVLRSHMQMPGGRTRDSVVYSIIRSEWPNIRTRLEQRLGRA